MKKISVGICGDAKAAAEALLERLQGRTLVSDATKAERAAKIQAEKDAWEQELDAWTHETDPYSLEMIEEQIVELYDDFLKRSALIYGKNSATMGVIVLRDRKSVV